MAHPGFLKRVPPKSHSRSPRLAFSEVSPHAFRVNLDFCFSFLQRIAKGSSGLSPDLQSVARELSTSRRHSPEYAFYFVQRLFQEGKQRTQSDGGQTRLTIDVLPGLWDRAEPAMSQETHTLQPEHHSFFFFFLM